MTVIVSVCVLILLVAAFFHFYWAFGGANGLSVAVPQLENGAPIFALPVAGSVFVGCFLLLAGYIAVVLAFHNGNLIPLELSRPIGFSLAFLFGVRALGFQRYVGFFKKVRSTRFAQFDSYLYSPLSLILSFGFFELSWP